MKKKTIFFTLTALLTCFTLTGCNFFLSNRENSQTETSETETTTNIPFSISIDYNDVADSITADDGTTLLNYSASFPEFEIAGYEISADNINDYYSQLNDDFADFIQDQMTDISSDYLNTGNDPNFPWNTYEIENTFEMVRGDEIVISVKESDYSYYGGPHPGTLYRADNFNTQTGELLTFDDIVTDPGDAHNFLTDYILDKMASPEYSGMFFDDYIDTVSGVDLNDRWYFSDEGFVVIFNEYDVAPYAAGHFEFTIPYDEFDYLLPDYK